MSCPECGYDLSIDWDEEDRKRAAIPPEPEIGTWVRDKYGAVSVRTRDSHGNVGWTAAPSGFYAFGKWEAMWEARGPLVECEPWGRDGS